MSGAPPSLTGTGVACHPPDPSPSQGWRSPPSLPAEQVAGRAPAVPPWRGALGGGRQSPSLTGTGDRTTLLQILPLPKMVFDWMK